VFAKYLVVSRGILFEDGYFVREARHLLGPHRHAYLW
jgi:hypothetical protein